MVISSYLLLNYQQQKETVTLSTGDKTWIMIILTIILRQNSKDVFVLECIPCSTDFGRSAPCAAFILKFLAEGDLRGLLEFCTGGGRKDFKDLQKA